MKDLIIFKNKYEFTYYIIMINSKLSIIIIIITTLSRYVTPMRKKTIGFVVKFVKRNTYKNKLKNATAVIM